MIPSAQLGQVRSGAIYTSVRNPRFSGRKPNESNPADSSWPRHPWYKRLWHHRFKVLTLPILLIPADPVRKLWALLGLILSYPLTRNPKRLAYHELGHLLSAENNGFPNPARAIRISNQDGLTDFRPPGVENEVSFFLREMKKSSRPLEYLKQVQELYAAGRMMELCALGHGGLGALADRISAAWITLRAMIRYPTEIPAICKLWLGKNRRAQELLLSLDKQKVDLLADKLFRERSWNRQEIARSLQMFGTHQAGADCIEPFV
jgi:hypothetical protein